MIYTDNIHMIADSLEELHTFAASIGMQREWFQNKKRHPHYDVFGIMLKHAISNGAVVIDSKELLKKSKKQK